jgi:hypothetical protein
MLFRNEMFSFCRIWGPHCDGYEEFWDITECSPLKVDRHFGQIYPIIPQVKQYTKKNRGKAGMKQGQRVLKMGRRVPPKRQLNHQKLKILRI